ncbi:hypothetical protein MKZ38_003419 [Zalerion maritima]|uniref:Uncharacterized protein n=1 Tax=Zalerion maritima TaxID=339359 RepID=A0AAD5WRT8_9PEZI|nr:hypothetical protein MKZ38_003419 [Zalerion maritima]
MESEVWSVTWGFGSLYFAYIGGSTGLAGQPWVKTTHIRIRFSTLLDVLRSLGCLHQAYTTTGEKPGNTINNKTATVTGATNDSITDPNTSTATTPLPDNNTTTNAATMNPQTQPGQQFSTSASSKSSPPTSTGGCERGTTAHENKGLGGMLKGFYHNLPAVKQKRDKKAGLGPWGRAT